MAKSESSVLKFLEFADLIGDTPIIPPRVTLFERAVFDNKDKHDYWTPGFFKSCITVQSILVKDRDLDACRDLRLDEVRSADQVFLISNEDRSHLIAGLQVERGIEIESAYFDHTWDGLQGESLVLPTQHLVMFLGLKQTNGDDSETTTWIDPLDVREVMARKDSRDANGNRKLSIELDYLRDYLAARKKSLYIRRWAERIVTFDKSQNLSILKSQQKKTTYGEIDFRGPQDVGGDGNPSWRATLVEHFVMHPASRPRHFRLVDRGEHLPAVDFTGADGNPVRFSENTSPLCIVSFNRDLLRLFNSPSRPRWTATNRSPGQLGLCFPRGASIWASDSPHGQIQILLCDLAKLDEEYQRALSPFSEIARGKPHSEWLNAGFNCIPASTHPWHERLETARLNCHGALKVLTVRNPITVDSPPLRANQLIRPDDRDEEAFFKIAKNIHRSLLMDGRKNEWFKSNVLPPSTIKDGIGSIGVIRQFVEKYDKLKVDCVAKPLDALNRFRQVDAHPVDANKQLIAHGYGDGNFATRYDKLLEALCTSLETLTSIASVVAAKRD